MSTKNKSRKTTRKSPAKRSPKSYKYNKKMSSPNKAVCLITIIILGVAALVAVAFITMFSTVRTKNAYEYGVKTDAERFAAEYTDVDTENVFVYKNAKETLDILEHGTGVVFLGFPECPWCQAYAKYLNEVAKENGIEKIYYYNIKKDREEDNADYQKFVEILGDHLQYDDEGHYRIYVPDVVFVSDGQIVGNDYETSKYTAGAKDPSEYWTEGRVQDLKARLNSFMQLVKGADCETTCNK
ncbi:hypothetical protein IJ098_00255 [Candidatus Saccharibacteria bacterium]|nr:hypothetical protein [Candidatus Saccharibacteria bacterium]